MTVPDAELYALRLSGDARRRLFFARINPAFPMLVREVAVGERHYRWGPRHTLNCPAAYYDFCLGSAWMRRPPEAHRRSWRLATDLARTLEVYREQPEPDVVAQVWNLARDWVRARRFPEALPGDPMADDRYVDVYPDDVPLVPAAPPWDPDWTPPAPVLTLRRARERAGRHLRWSRAWQQGVQTP